LRGESRHALRRIRRRITRDAWSLLRFRSSIGILRPVPTSGNFELSLGENILPRSLCGLLRHQVAYRAADSFLAGDRLTNGVADVARRFTKTVSAKKHRGEGEHRKNKSEL
jgi:hypothetical protein